jgi:hypothetical protein
VPDAGPGPALPRGQQAVPLRRFGLFQFAGWRPPEPLPAVLAVRGAVESPAVIDLADLAAVLPRCRQRSDLHCVATWSTPDLLWSGFPFGAVHDLLVELVAPTRRPAGSTAAAWTATAAASLSTTCWSTGCCSPTGWAASR